MRDKLMHFAAGVIVAAPVAWAATPLIGVAAAVVVGIAKELYDGVSGKGTRELADALATVVGGVVGAVCGI